MTVNSLRLRRPRWREFAALLLISGLTFPAARPAVAQGQASVHSLSGVITVEGLATGAPAQSVTIYLFPKNNGPFLTKTANVDASGDYLASNIPSGVYDLWIKADYHLAAGQSNVDLTAADQSVSVFLSAGDVNNDNNVDATDFNTFISAYGSDINIPGTGYDPKCDFNSDGKVDATDFGTFVQNYNTQGATAPPTVVPGKWDIETSYDGHSSALVTYDNGAPPWSQDLIWSNAGIVSAAPGFCPMGSKVHCELTGSVRVIYTWVPDTYGIYPPPPNPVPDAPPKTLYLLEASFARTLGHAAGQANDGADDATVTTPAPYSEVQVISQGRHLVQHDSSSGTVNIKHQLSGSLDDIGPNSDGAGVRASFFTSIDERSAMITCPSIEIPANHHAGSPNDDVGSGVYFPGLNTRDSDGSITVDTVVDDDLDLPRGQPNSWKVLYTLSLVANGFDLDSTFNGELLYTQIDWSGASPADYGHGPYGINANVGKQGANSEIRTSPSIISAKVTVKDLRNGLTATAENTYTIRAHSPLENSHEIVSKRVFDHNDVYPWSTKVAANSSASVLMVAQEPTHYFLRDNATTIATFVSGVLGSGVVGLIPESIVALPAWSPIVADMVFNVLGYGVSTYGTPTPDITQPEYATFAAFSQAVDEQVAIDNGATDAGPALPSDPGTQVDCVGDTRIIFGTDTTIDYIAAHKQWYWNNKLPVGRCHSGARMMRCTIGGDQYNVNGYVGYHEYTAPKMDRYLNPVWQWDLTQTYKP